MTRNGKPDAEVMDNLVYNYENEEGVLMSNKLLYIDDDPVVNPDYDDIRDQSVGNYGYDAVGNLTQDESEDIASISYSMSNKVVQINRNSTSEKQNIKYSYDAMGNRVMKKTWYPNGGTLPVYEKTWYVRDAQGNIMATYTWEGSNSPELQQQYIYGSQRLGYVDREGLPIPENIMHAIGLKKYELSNHLGNVLVTISDRPVSVVDESNTFIEGYTADIVSAGDYYPGGSLMPGRNYSPDNYRFGYQGSEKDDEIAGVSGAHITTFFRENDTRILRWWSVDPKTNLTPWESPYMSMGGNPIWFNDPKGDLRDWWKNNSTGEAEKIDHRKLWHKNEMAKKGYSYLGEYQTDLFGALDEPVYFNTIEIFNADQDLWIAGHNLGGRYGSMGGGEHGLKQASEFMNDFGTALLLTPAALIGEGFIIMSVLIDTGLDYKNKSITEATENLLIRGATIGIGKAIGGQTEKHIKNTFGKRVIDAGVSKSLDDVKDKAIEKTEEINEKDE